MTNAGVRLPGSGVYVVCLDPDITGSDNVVWCFANESDADVVVRVLEAEFGEGRAWHSFEPVSLDLLDPDLVDYMRSRLGCRHAEARRRLRSAESD